MKRQVLILAINEVSYVEIRKMQKNFTGWWQKVL